MKYEEAFTNYEKMFIDAAKDGFFLKNYSAMYLFWCKKNGTDFANDWANKNSKLEKRLYCANILANYSQEPQVKEKAKEFIEKMNKKKK